MSHSTRLPRPDPRIQTLLRRTEDRLRRQQEVLADLVKRLPIHDGGFDSIVRQITEAAADALDVERVSVWLYGSDRCSLRCCDCFERAANRHTSAMELPAAAYPAYLRAIEEGGVIAANDAMSDPRTAALGPDHLEPFGIVSTLDAPVRVSGEVAGVICHGCAEPRLWSEHEVTFAESMAALVAIAIDAGKRRAAEESLRKHVEIENLIGRNIAGIYRNTIEGRIIDCNDALASMLGYSSREELMSQRAADLYIDPAERARVVEQLRKQRVMTGLEICLRRKDGRPVWLIENMHLIEGDGEPEILEGTLIDISDRKFAEDALKASEGRYRLLIERMREGLSQVNNDGVVEFVNDRFCEMVGYTREELIGRRADMIAAFPEDVETIQSKHELRLWGVSDQYEIRVRRKDGRIIWVEIGGAPVTDASGHVVGSIGVHDDITERRRAEEALRESEARYRLMAENSTDMISRSTAEGIILYASDAARTLMGYEPAELAGRSVFDLIVPGDRSDVRRAGAGLKSLAPMTFSYRVHRKDGATVWFESTSRALIDPTTGLIQEIVSVTRDISERKKAEEQIEYQAYHDALTGLPNRLLFRDRLTVALARARRQNQNAAVMFLDLDRFKVVNDTLGHSFGDELLKAIAERLRRSLREADSIARMGGDEFTILLTDLASGEDAAMIAEKLLEAIAQPLLLEGQQLFLTTSIGIAVFPTDGETAETLLRSADSAMYRAKDSGRNAFQLCTPAMNSRAVERLGLENALRRAIDRGELILHYQPQVEIATGRIVGMEALLRWDHPTLGLTQPETFISIAEETRLIIPIGEWVLNEACTQTKAWQASRFPGLRIAVNLSPRQFQQADLRRMIAGALAGSGLAASDLEIEVTESTAMQNTERTVTTLRGLREMGTRIAIDDFGTGHSSLNYLRSFPIDTVKIDQAFVHEIEASVSDRAIISAIIAMARGLKLRVTAEGVETDEQLRFLRDAGCDEVQGFLLGRPVPAGEV
ncbi:MAG TPA: EAL domain-containing protein [Thermoanaerobaculia bacterium]|nr:EAL domain-containing protein [Thermoanaerobaculia bacterium]